MKKVIILSIVIAAIGLTISCKKSTPVENVQKQPVFIRVYSPETNIYSQTTIIKL